MKQVRKYKNLTTNVLHGDIKTSDIFSLIFFLKNFHHLKVIIEKLKHKKNNLTLQELISHLRTAKANCLKDMIETFSLNSSKANLVKSSGTIVKDMFKGKHKKILKKNK